MAGAIKYHCLTYPWEEKSIMRTIRESVKATFKLSREKSTGYTDGTKHPKDLGSSASCRVRLLEGGMCGHPFRCLCVPPPLSRLSKEPVLTLHLPCAL